MKIIKALSLDFASMAVLCVAAVLVTIAEGLADVTQATLQIGVKTAAVAFHIRKRMDALYPL